MKLWAQRLDPDFPHSERVASLALQLYDGLLAMAWQPAIDASSARSSLLAAALLHDVGKIKGKKNHHKQSLKLIQSHGNPLGWKPAEFQRAAIIARFHRGALPTARHKQLRDLLHAEQKATIQLAAILRLANALDAAHDGHVRRIQIENIQVKAESNRQKRTGGFLRKLPGLDRNEPLVVAVEGYAPLGWAARTIAAERYLLETVLRRPVFVKPMIHGTRLASRQIR
jgi:exopolyphosphatase/pppGpp-phosphohydrolase